MLDLLVQSVAAGQRTPDQEDFRCWAEAALKGRRKLAELTIRLVDEEESRRLNRQYRGQDNATNVLSFSCELPSEVETALLGDLVVCVPVVNREAVEQGKSPDAHWAHMVVHGVLHLLGFDHSNEEDAGNMESIEISVLSRLGFPNPY